MRVLILVVLGFAFAAALPQNEERSRVRGIRRFSLATPGLQAGRISDNEVVNDLGEEKPAVAEGTEPKTRSRGTSILRRGHPSRRLIGRPASENQDPSATVAVEAIEDAPAKGTGRGRDGLRIRRPIKKITTAAVATTISSQMTEEAAVAADSATQTFISTTSASTTVSSESGTIMQKTEESMLTEESKPIIRDEAVQDQNNMKDIVPNQEQGSEVAEEDPASSKSELKSQGLPRPKKLRPIPIKLGRRGQGEAEQPAAPIDVAPEEPEQLTSGNQAPSHRFSSRPRPSLSRRRPINREANQQQEEVQPAAVKAPIEEGPKKTQTRSRVPVLSRQPARISPRRRISQQPETVAEDSPVSVVEDSAVPNQEPEIRVLDINELKTLLTTISEDEVVTPTQNARIRPRIRRPSQTLDEVTDIRSEIDSTPSVEAPVSESVRIGRPQTIGNRGSPEPSTHQDTEHAPSKYPTPRYGGSDLLFRAGEVHVTQIGTIEDTPTEEVRRILSGLGSKRRGLGRPKASTRTKTESPAIHSTPTDSVAASTNQDLQSNIDFLYDYYEQ